MYRPYERMVNPVKCREDDQRVKCSWCAFYEAICLPRAAYKVWANFHCEFCILKRDEPWPAMMEEVKDLQEKEEARLKLSDNLS